MRSPLGLTKTRWAGGGRVRFLSPTARPVLLVVALLVLAAACSGGTNLADAARAQTLASRTGASESGDVAVTSNAEPFGDDVSCSGGFVPHDLDHITRGPGDTASTFDGTGAGVAAEDLDADGDIDIVLANLFGETTAHYNDGTGVFTAQPLVEGRFRQVTTVDVEGDGDTDIVLSTGLGSPYMLENTSDGFVRGTLDGVSSIAYSLGWSDLGGDGDLDLVTGSYNAELTQVRNTPVLGTDAGVIINERDGDAYTATRVAAVAQTLSIRIVDINNDGLPDIIAGNDLATPDGIWLDNDGGWLPVDSFATTSFSTMSIDAGDVDNDGDFDLFSTDMKPMDDSPETRNRYVEVVEDMQAMPVPDDVQTPENVLLTGTDGAFTNTAPSLGISATGWSWSGLFGDLDDDGLLDLYVVNGMRSDLLFDFLPNEELVEPNQVFRNGGAVMAPMPEWGLADEAGGRGQAMADLDGDGDLDIIVNNLGSSSRWFENQVCGGSSIIVDLEWSGSANTNALGAIVRVAADVPGADAPLVQSRSIDSNRGYLSSSPAVAHMGLGATTDPVTVLIEWPDGLTSLIENVEPDSRLTVDRTTAVGDAG